MTIRKYLKAAGISLTTEIPKLFNDAEYPMGFDSFEKKLAIQKALLLFYGDLCIDEEILEFPDFVDVVEYIREMLVFDFSYTCEKIAKIQDFNKYSMGEKGFRIQGMETVTHGERIEKEKPKTNTITESRTQEQTTTPTGYTETNSNTLNPSSKTTTENSTTYENDSFKLKNQTQDSYTQSTENTTRTMTYEKDESILSTDDVTKTETYSQFEKEYGEYTDGTEWEKDIPVKPSEVTDYTLAELSIANINFIKIYAGLIAQIMSVPVWG